MNNEQMLRDKLRGMVEAHGRNLLRYPEQCEQVMVVEFLDFAADTWALRVALRNGVPETLLEQGISAERIASLVAMVAAQGMPETTARVAVEAWAYALGWNAAVGGRPRQARTGATNWKRTASVAAILTMLYEGVGVVVMGGGAPGSNLGAVVATSLLVWASRRIESHASKGCAWFMAVIGCLHSIADVLALTAGASPIFVLTLAANVTMAVLCFKAATDRGAPQVGYAGAWDGVKRAA